MTHPILPPVVPVGMYVTNADTGTVHIFDPDKLFGTTYETEALCGRRVDNADSIGDETVSGHMSTCRKCRKVFAAHGPNPDLDPDPRNTI
jgi:hypothetical protein